MRTLVGALLGLALTAPAAHAAYRASAVRFLGSRKRTVVLAC